MHKGAGLLRTWPGLVQVDLDIGCRVAVASSVVPAGVAQIVAKPGKARKNECHAVDGTICQALTTARPHCKQRNEQKTFLSLFLFFAQPQ